MKRLASLLIASFIALLAFGSIAPRLYAFDSLQNICDGSSEATSSSVCQDRNKGTIIADPQNGLLPKIANIVAAVGGLLAVIFIMVNGFTFMTSTGDSAKTSKAREGLIYAAIGLAIIVMARVIIALIMRYV